MSVLKQRAREITVRANLSDLYDFDRFTTLQRRILDDLGCTACTSGVNIRFDIDRYLDARSEKIISITAKPDDEVIASQTVNVVAPIELVNTYKGNMAARQAVLTELGHPACTSGFNIRFESELAFALDSEAKVIDLAR